MNNGINNSGMYNLNSFPGNPLYSQTSMTPNQTTAPTTFSFPTEQSYIENILRLNRGKKVNVYTTFPDATEWRDKVFSGIIEQSGRDHLILSDPNTGKWYLLLMIYVNFVEFDENINYSQEFIPNN